jgi:TolB-like protein
MKTLFCLLAFAFSVAFATRTVAVLPSDGTLSDDESELLTDKMREAALKVLPVSDFTLLKQDVFIKRLGGMENYIKECSETSCIVSLGKKAQVDYVAQCRVGKLKDNLRITVELYEVSTGGLLGMFSDIAADFYQLPPLMDKNVPDVFKNIITEKQAAPAVQVAPVASVVYPDKPKIAVYVANDGLKDAEKKVFSKKILSPFIQSGKYGAIEQGDVFLDNISKEQKKQRSGSINDSQIGSIGKKAGARFICIADLIDAFGIYSVSVRLIDVENEEMLAFGETEIKDLSEIGNAANEIFRQINGSSNMAAKKQVPTVKKPATRFEALKQISEWREIKINFYNKENFFNVARQGFMSYLKKYNPREFSRDGEWLVMTAKYGRHDIMCTFFQDGDSRYIVALESEAKRERAKWVNNVVKYVEKAGRK